LFLGEQDIFFGNGKTLIYIMKTVIQRVSGATVTVGERLTGAIEKGLLVLVGIEDADNDEDIKWLSNKIINLRIFDDENKVPNISVKDIDGDILVVSQFTLQASTKKGNRPSYIKASKAEIAIPLYEKLVIQLSQELGKTIHTGEFGADMKVALINDGPVTIVIDTKNRE
jgi:D-tyrosyl-tRNA(Tyr) deacylase